MKLVVAVVRDEVAGQLTEQLMVSGYSATKLASTGGFLRAGNSTFLIGVPAPQVDAVLGVIRQACPAKKGGGAVPAAKAVPGGSDPTEVQVGAATVFVLDVEKLLKV